MKIGKMILEGKGKRIYSTDDPSEAVVYYKDEALAFHGLKRGRILGKGEINNAICCHLFSLLAEGGVENHFIRKLDARQSLIRRVQIIPVTITVRNIAAGGLVKRIGWPEGTRLPVTVIEYQYKNDELDYPMINLTHVLAMKLATAEEMAVMERMALRVNEVLSAYLSDIHIELIDFKVEFGRYGGRILLADEVSPDTCRFWDARTHEPLDLDRFRLDLGGVEEAYHEVLRRLMGMNDAESAEGELS